MALSIAQLGQVVSVEDALELQLRLLERLGFSARSWQPGSVARTLVELNARLLSAQSEAIRTLALAGYNETAEGPWLALFSKSHYDNTKKPGLRTRGLVTLTAGAQAPTTMNFGASDLVFADPKTGRTYRNLAPITLAAGQSVTALIEAEQIGAEGDVPNGAITEMRTPVAGVTAANRPLAGERSWITVNGADDELDQHLRERNRLKWATRSASSLPGLGYAAYALEASLSVRRAWVDDQNPRGPGSLDLYLAGDVAEVSDAVVADVERFLRGEVDGVPRMGLGANLLVKSARRVPVPVRGTAYLAAAYNTEPTQRAINAAIRTYFRALPIGGTRLSPSTRGRVVFGELYRAVLSIAGVRNVSFTSPSDDLELEPGVVAIPSIALRFESV